MKVLIIALLVIIPTASNANGYYDSLLNNLLDNNVKESFSIDDFHDERGGSIYKMEVEKATGGDLYDRISGSHIETMATCRMTSNSSKALLVKGKRSNQLFLENGYSCGIKDIFIE